MLKQEILLVSTDATIYLLILTLDFFMSILVDILDSISISSLTYPLLLFLYDPSVMMFKTLTTLYHEVKQCVSTVVAGSGTNIVQYSAYLLSVI